MLDLRQFPTAVINIPGQADRRDHITRHFAGIGMTPQFIDGVTGVGKIRGCAQSHAAAFDAMPSTPFMVIEDDVELLWDEPVIPDVPVGADTIYLGTNTGGCFPNSEENKANFGHRSLSDFALASEHDDNYLRMHSMVGAHAILFLNEEAKKVYRNQLRIANNRKTPLDVRYAYLMPQMNVYALRRPMFAEAQHLQANAKTSQSRFEVTHSPLTPSRPGDIRVGEKRGKRVTAEAVDTGNGLLEWSVVDMVPLDEPAA